MGEGFSSRSLWPTKKPNILLAVLTYCSYSVCALLSLLPTHGTHSTVPSLVLPANMSTLAAPVSPPGFDIDINYDTSKELNPLAVYLCAVDYMYHFAQKDWSERLVGGFTVGVDGFNVEIDIASSQGPYGLQLLTSHIILGLYETIIDVSANSRFCEVTTTLSLYGRQIGVLLIQKRGVGVSKEGGINSTGPVLVKGPTNSTTVAYPSGHLVDADDPDFSISYTYSGARINSKDVFMAVLDALATAAQFSPSTPFGSLTARSPSGSCVINIAEEDSPFPINFSFVTKALRVVIVDIMVRLRNFGALALELEWQNVKMAEGSISLGDHGTTTQ